MAFDFYEAAEDMTPAEAELRVSATAGGVCNAVAFWFELQLDASTSLSTSPYAEKARMHQHHDNLRLLVVCCIVTNNCKGRTADGNRLAGNCTPRLYYWAPMEAAAHGDQGPTWQQAVQWVEEMPVAQGDCLTVTTAHDTYGLSFRIQNAAMSDQAAGGELMPLQVCGHVVHLRTRQLHMAAFPAKRDHSQNVGIGSRVERSSGRCECSQRSALARGRTKPAGVPGGRVRSAAPGRAAA